jgi:myo-inositol-1(or 4)-monophosphatase
MPEFLPQMETVAREAGALLMRYFRQRIGYEYKGEADLVTQADRESEKLISDFIRRQWPTHDLVGEEGARRETGSEYRWYIDPLDGTTNFAHGFPVFCVSLGLMRRDECVAGLIYDPTRDECFAAEKGSGATLNGQRIRVSQTTELKRSLLATGFPSFKRHQNPNIFFYHQLSLRSHGLRRPGAAALDLTTVAAGRIDGYWEFNLNPWDTCAGVLLVREAGGLVTCFDGSPWLLDSRQTLASNGLIHQELLTEFDAIFQGRGLEGLPDPVQYLAGRSARH